MPFLKSNKIIINLKNKKIYELFKKILSIKKIKNNTIIIKEKYFNKFQNKINVQLYNKWDFIPEFNLINIVRYIINNYYDKKCLEIFDKSLNLNLNYFIRNNYNHLSFDYLNKLMSKIYFFIFIGNKGNYEIINCIGKGRTGRVCKKFILLIIYRFLNVDVY